MQRLLPALYDQRRSARLLREGHSADEAIAAVEALRSQGAVGLVFDMRENPGGQLSELLKLLDYLLPEGKLFISCMTDGKEHIDYSDADFV